MSPQGIDLPISPSPFSVFVTLITRDVDHHTRLFGLSQRLQEIYRPHDIRRVRLDWILVTTTHNGLRSHVNDDFGLALGYRRFEPWEVANIAVNGSYDACDLRLLKQTRLGWRVKSISRYLGSKCI